MTPHGAVDIIRKLRTKGHEAYLVGGCVRDLVMEIEPSDYDIATSALPEEIMRIFPRTETIGVQFGVVLVIHRGHPYEVATFRSDEAYVDGRRPTGVVFTDARTDVMRRDFTINGLLYDPIDGCVIDYVSGKADIKAKIVRAIGDPQTRFEEDKLRILRAIRFGARLGYTIEPETWAAVCRMAPSIRQVSIERIREELIRILTEGQAARGCRMLVESGLMNQILPEVHWDNHLERSLTMLAPAVPGDLAMAVLLHEVPANTVRTIVERMKFSRAEMLHIASLVENRARFATVQSMPVHGLKRFFRLSRFEDHLELARICAVASGGALEDYNYALLMHRTWSQEDISPQPLISGEDLITLGLRPGPLFKEILTRVEDEQLEGRVLEHSKAIEFVRANYMSRKR
jgi:poly(A) polymerase